MLLTKCEIQLKMYQIKKYLCTTEIIERDPAGDILTVIFVVCNLKINIRLLSRPSTAKNGVHTRNTFLTEDET